MCKQDVQRQGDMPLEIGSNKLVILLTVVSIGFVAWIIYKADTGKKGYLFELAHQLPYGDKIGHLLLFAGLAFVLNLALSLRGLKLGPVKLYWGSLGVLVFSYAEEFRQYYVPGRTFDRLDLVADALGVLIATLITWLLAIVLRQIARRRGARSPVPQES